MFINDFAAKRKQFSSKENIKDIGFLFFIALAYFLHVLIAGNSQVISAQGTDIWSQYFYWREFGFANLRRGDFPLWNPYVFRGRLLSQQVSRRFSIR